VVETNSGGEMSQEMSQGNLAVFGVVIAGVLTTIVEPGPDTWGAVVIGILLLLVLLAYDNRPDDESYGHSAAFAAAWAFSVLLLPGWLLNPVLFKPPYEPGVQMVQPV
jgi:hypothetical protein